MDGSDISTLAGSIDALLYAEHVLLQLSPGKLVPSLARRLRDCPLPGRFSVFHTTCPLSSIQQGLRQPILGVTPGVCFLDHPSLCSLRLAPARCIDHQREEAESFPVPPICLVLLVGVDSPPDDLVSESESFPYCSPSHHSLFGSSLPRVGLLRIYDGSSVHLLSRREESARGVEISRSSLIPIPSRFPD